MPVPKSVTKIKKNGIEYSSEVDKCQYFIFELTRAALRDSAKICVKRFNEKLNAAFKSKTRNKAKATKYNVYSNAKTLYPHVEIGLKGAKGFYGYFQELGSSKTPKMGLLQKAVQESVPDIITAQSKYLSAMESEAQALSMISEEEYEGGDE